MSFLTKLHAVNAFPNSPLIHLFSDGRIFVLGVSYVVALGSDGGLVNAIEVPSGLTIGDYLDRGTDSLHVSASSTGGMYSAAIDPDLLSIDLTNAVTAIETGYYGETYGSGNQLRCVKRDVTGVMRTAFYRTGGTLNYYYRNLSYLGFKNEPVAFSSNSVRHFTVVKCFTDGSNTTHVHAIVMQDALSAGGSVDLSIQSSDFISLQVYQSNYDNNAFVNIIGNPGFQTSFILKSLPTPVVTLSSPDTLRYLASSSDRGIYVTLDIDGVFYLRRYTESLLGNILTVEWTKQIDILGFNGDYICSGSCVDSLLTLVLKSSDDAIYILQISVDCVKNGIYGDIEITDGVSTDISRTGLSYSASTANMTTFSSDTFDNSSLSSFASISITESDLYLPNCGEVYSSIPLLSLSTISAVINALTYASVPAISLNAIEASASSLTVRTGCTTLSIIQAACGRIGLQKPTYAFGNSDITTIQMIGLLIEEVNELTRRAQWQVLRQEASWVTTHAETQGSLDTLIPNMAYIINDTIWNRSLKRPIFGPLTSQTYQQNKAFYQAGPWSQYTIMGGFIRFYPAPAAGQSIYLEYVTTAIGTNYLGETINDFTDDRDIPLLDCEAIRLGLIWRFKMAKGFDYAEDYQKYDRRVNDLIARDATKPILDMGTTRFDMMPGIVVPIGSWNV